MMTFTKMRKTGEVQETIKGCVCVCVYTGTRTQSKSENDGFYKPPMCDFDTGPSQDILTRRNVKLHTWVKKTNAYIWAGKKKSVVAMIIQEPVSFI